MSKTVEELLNPRYKVIAGWPNAAIPVATILTLKGSTWEAATPMGESPWYRIDEYDFNEWPHLFKKLEWYEDRQLEEMPEYIKFYVPLPQKVKYGKVVNWIPKIDCMWVQVESNPSQNLVLGSEDFPCTKEEYNQYISSGK